MYLISYCIGNIIGPQTFRPKDQPRYVPAEIIIIVCYVSASGKNTGWSKNADLYKQCVCLCDLAFIYFYYRRQNRKKALARAQPGYVKLENQEFLDLTDRENPEFNYIV